MAQLKLQPPAAGWNGISSSPSTVMEVVLEAQAAVLACTPLPELAAARFKRTAKVARGGRDKLISGVLDRTGMRGEMAA